MRLLPGARPAVHVTVRGVLALPAEGPVLVAQGLLDEVDSLPVALDVVHRVGVVGRHLGATRLHEADLETPARDDVGGGVFLGDANRIFPERDQRAETQDADLSRLARQYAYQQRVGAEQLVDLVLILDRPNSPPAVISP